MQLILEGLVLGLSLTLLVGPIFIAITQASIEGGARAGLTVALGEWLSDFVIIWVCYHFMQRLSKLLDDSVFIYWTGMAGGLMLIAFGIGTFIKKSKIGEPLEQQKLSTKNYLHLLTKGVLVNSINPFTFGFWISITSIYVLGKGINDGEAAIFFGGIMFVIICSDTVKVLLAKLIRKKLLAKHIDVFSKIAGTIMVIFGIALLLKAGIGS